MVYTRCINLIIVSNNYQTRIGCNSHPTAFRQCWGRCPCSYSIPCMWQPSLSSSTGHHRDSTFVTHLQLRSGMKMVYTWEYYQGQLPKVMIIFWSLTINAYDYILPHRNDTGIESQKFGSGDPRSHTCIVSIIWGLTYLSEQGHHLPASILGCFWKEKNIKLSLPLPPTKHCKG